MLNTDRQTDRHTIDKRDATKNTRAKTFNNRIYTVGLLYSCFQVDHGHLNARTDNKNFLSRMLFKDIY